jgi:hypothetical protein
MLRTTALFILVFVLATQGWAQMTVKNQSTGTTLMQVTDAGQVGIALGSTAPQATLDVGGTLRIGTVNVEGNNGDISVLVWDGGVVKKRTLTADIWDGDATGVGSETDPEWSANDDDHVIGNERPIAGNHITISNTYTVNHADGSSQSSVNGSGRRVIQDVSLDTYGHVTGLNTTTLADNVNDADHDPTGELQTLSQVLSRGRNANDQEAYNFDRMAIGTSSFSSSALNVAADANKSWAVHASGQKSYFSDPVYIGSETSPPIPWGLYVSDPVGPSIGFYNEGEDFTGGMGVGGKILRLYSERGMSFFMDVEDTHGNDEIFFQIGHGDYSHSADYYHLFHIDGHGNLYARGDVSGESITDRTPYPQDLQSAYDAVFSMHRLPEGEYQPDNKAHQLDHAKLHPFIRSADDHRDLSATVSSQNEVIKDLVAKNETLLNRIERLERLLNITLNDKGAQP